LPRDSNVLRSHAPAPCRPPIEPRRPVMVPTLIESARRTDKQRVLGTAVVSLTIHAGVIAGAVFATLQVKGTDHTVKVDTTMVLHEHFDPKDYSGAGVEGGRAQSVAPDDNRVYLETVVEQRPELLSGPPPYPELLRGAGVRGRVVLQAVVDTTGRLEPNSIKIVQSPHAGFGPPIRQWE